jgi:RNA polymerase-binding protein DksA
MPAEINRQIRQTLEEKRRRLRLWRQNTHIGNSKRVREKTRKELSKVEKALEKLKKGTYGQCTQCGAKIHPQRLQLLPTVNLCFECKLKREQH